MHFHLRKRQTFKVNFKNGVFLHACIMKKANYQAQACTLERWELRSLVLFQKAVFFSSKVLMLPALLFLNFYLTHQRFLPSKKKILYNISFFVRIILQLSQQCM